MFHLTLESSNAKTGPIPVSTSSASTCPDACPLKAGGCYAKSGPLGMHWQRVSSGQRGELWAQFLERVRSIKLGSLWRHNQAGDLPGKGNRINGRMLAQLVRANKGRRGFTYTHKPPLRHGNARKIHEANAAGFTVNLSANNLAHADELKSYDVGPVVTIVPTGSPAKGETPKGNKWILCPAQQRDDITCADCGLCSVAKRSVIVAFEAHGTSKRKASAIASA